MANIKCMANINNQHYVKEEHCYSVGKDITEP